MGCQIIKQPNGKYAVWSSIVDGFILLDVTREEIIEDFVDHERDMIVIRVNAACDKLDAEKPAYHQFSMTWDEAVKKHLERYPDESGDFDGLMGPV